MSRRWVRSGRGRVGVELLRPRTSAAGSGTEVVGYTKPRWIRWSEAIGNGRARFCTAHNFIRVATSVGDTSRLSR